MLSLESCRRFAKDIAMGLKYIHSKGFVHNDIKLDNILVVEQLKGSKTRMIAKINDFGASFKAVDIGWFGIEWPIRMKLRYATPYCCPPECVEWQPLSDARLSDVWAFGLVVYELITYHILFPLFGDITDIFDPNVCQQRVETLMKSQSMLKQLPNTEVISDCDRNEIKALLRRLLNPKVSTRE